MVLVLSVFNGFESLLSNLLNNFNPDLKVLPTEGKFFEVDDSTYQVLSSIEGLELVSKTIEEVALFEYNDTQRVGVIKGVDTLFAKATSIDSAMNRGTYLVNRM